MDTSQGLHVGIIMDGNRRYAKKKGLISTLGHYHGAKSLEKLLKDIYEDNLDIKEVTFYAFSMENFKRSNEELDALFKVFRENMKVLNSDKKFRPNARIRFRGRLNLFPEDLQEEMNKIMASNNDDYKITLNFLMAYNGQDEIADAVNKIIGNGEKEITRDTIKKHIYLNDSKEADIIIRTGMDDGARLSGFMLWDSSYAELYFLKEFWPEFSHKMLKEIVEDYKNNRHRRFGK
jgi:undecaprenyl diphosphate synthase